MSEETSTVLTAPVAADLTPADRLTLEEAVRHLQASRGLIVRAADLLAGLVGTAASYGVRGLQLSPDITARMQGIAEVALQRAFATALLGMDRTPFQLSATRARWAVGLSGAVSGFFGLAGFLPDAAFTTLLIMRSIAAVARQEGEDLADDETQKACLEVFAFGSPSIDPADPREDAEASYWSARLLMHGRPIMLVVSEIAARYGMRMSEKFAAQAVPLAGAAGGAVVNTLFLNHYRTMARVHFTMRRLERAYGVVPVRSAAQEIARNLHLARTRDA